MASCCFSSPRMLLTYPTYRWKGSCLLRYHHFFQQPLKPCCATASLLTARTIMTAASCDDNPLDGGAAYQAGPALSAIHAMPQLKESLLAFGIDVIVYRRPAQLDGLAQDRF